MTTVSVSFVPDIGDLDHVSGSDSEITFTRDQLASSASFGSLLVPMSERYLVIPVRMLRAAGTNQIRLRGRVPWQSYRLLFGSLPPHSHRVKTEYHRRSCSRGRKR